MLAGMSTSGEYRVDTDEVRALAGAVTAEILRAYNVLQSIRAIPEPDFGSVGGSAAAAIRALRQELERSLETTIERLNAVNMLLIDAARSYAELDASSAYSFREVR
jgi:hypothetical protein